MDRPAPREKPDGRAARDRAGGEEPHADARGRVPGRIDEGGAEGRWEAESGELRRLDPERIHGDTAPRMIASPVRTTGMAGARRDHPIHCSRRNRLVPPTKPAATQAPPASASRITSATTRAPKTDQRGPDQGVPDHPYTGASARLTVSGISWTTWGNPAARIDAARGTGIDDGRDDGSRLPFTTKSAAEPPTGRSSARSRAARVPGSPRRACFTGTRSRVMVMPGVLAVRKSNTWPTTRRAWERR